MVLVIVLLIFGAKRLPELGRSVGETMRGFRESVAPPENADAKALPEATMNRADSTSQLSETR
jgi:sec-independent protein translocase protein TatA